MKKGGREGLALLKSSKPARVIAKYINLILRVQTWTVGGGGATPFQQSLLTAKDGLMQSAGKHTQCERGQTQCLHDASRLRALPLRFIGRARPAVIVLPWGSSPSG